ncbi:hypothetical protein T4D_559 [Trichinella pseudospiralis]|uniref:Uncharacterized protein n=1 Tax=Trichinella pseudospiralis TaxID=6337 RepID=A0A0V1FC47_TRIPS|nr:hypothetical protein T4D_559 [Trichinella pseudospiralis]
MQKVTVDVGEVKLQLMIYCSLSNRKVQKKITKLDQVKLTIITGNIIRSKGLFILLKFESLSLKQNFINHIVI